jgi:hypothetical protein
MNEYKPEIYYESILKICKKILDTVSSLEEETIPIDSKKSLIVKNKWIDNLFGKGQNIAQVVASISSILYKTMPMYEKAISNKDFKSSVKNINKLSQEELDIIAQITKKQIE